MTQHPKDHRKLWLEKLIKENNFTLGAELGVHEGVTHFHLLDNCPSLTMIGVDRYQGIQEKYWMLFNLKQLQYGSRAVFYRTSTVEASKNVQDGELDFVFIDADHSYSAVLADIKAWAPKVREGGYITGHDCDMPNVKKALIEIFGEGGYETAQDEVWYVKK
jgi:predicted O-methyltransferase YrrM